MRHVRIALPIIVAATMVGCSGSSSPAAPTPPPTPACQANHTASVTFRNIGGGTVDVLWDGFVIGTLGAGQSGLTRTVAANVAHSLNYRLTNTTRLLCATSNPVPVECGDTTYSSCTY
jgi:hypothetical protein